MFQTFLTVTKNRDTLLHKDPEQFVCGCMCVGIVLYVCESNQNKYLMRHWFLFLCVTLLISPSVLKALQPHYIHFLTLDWSATHTLRNTAVPDI